MGYKGGESERIVDRGTGKWCNLGGGTRMLYIEPCYSGHDSVMGGHAREINK